MFPSISCVFSESTKFIESVGEVSFASSKFLVLKFFIVFLLWNSPPVWLDKTPTETPVEAPAETPVETPAETPAEAPAETPAETPTEEPAEAKSTLVGE